MKFILLLSSLVLGFDSMAQTRLPETKCAAYARSMMRTALRMETKGVFKLVEVKDVKKFVPSTGETLILEQLIYMSEGASVTVRSIPDYYEKGVCELESIVIKRD